MLTAFQTMAYIFIFMIPMSYVNSCLQQSAYGYKARWFLLHAIVNGFVVVLTLPYVFRMLTEHLPVFETATLIPSCLVMSLHLFHSMEFVLNRMDVIHHVIMSLVLLFPLCNAHNTDYVATSNYCLFFLSGLPGGIDYYLMFLVETNQLPSLTEKHYNTYLNTWIRAIGILYGVFLTHQAYLVGRASAGCALAVCIALTWNAQYFSSAVSYGYGYALANIQNEYRHSLPHERRTPQETVCFSDSPIQVISR